MTDNSEDDILYGLYFIISMLIILLLFSLGKGSKKKKKNLEFSRFGLTHPPHPCNREKSGKKNFMLLKCFLSYFETFFLTPYQF